MKKINVYLKFAVIFLYVVTIYFAGYTLYIISGIIRSLAYGLMMMINSAKYEIKEVLQIYRS